MKRGKFLAATLGIAGVGMLALGMSSTSASAQAYYPAPVCAAGYYYANGSHANALETKAGLTWGALSFNAQTLLNDVVWGNKGDTYWTLVYTKPLPYDITFTGTLGAYTYSREGKYLGTRDTATGTSCGAGQAFVVNGCFAGNGPSSGGLRHLTLGLSAPFPDSSITWSLQAILGGYNRFDVKQGNQLVGMLSWGF